mmetsp:Transcript_19894/g.27633  ORF Transcript_19894/g.27633 Transcript_19894/m.27633 type:complete len:464 (-) Transcript_19894:144-1535(-)
MSYRLAASSTCFETHRANSKSGTGKADAACGTSDKSTQTESAGIFGVAENLDAIASEFKKILDERYTNHNDFKLDEQHTSSTETSPESRPMSPTQITNRNKPEDNIGELVVAYNPQAIDPKTGAVVSLCRDHKTGKLAWVNSGMEPLQPQALCVDQRTGKTCWLSVPEALSQIRKRVYHRSDERTGQYDQQAIISSATCSPYNPIVPNSNGSPVQSARSPLTTKMTTAGRSLGTKTEVSIKISSHGGTRKAWQPKLRESHLISASGITKALAINPARMRQSTAASATERSTGPTTTSASLEYSSKTKRMQNQHPGIPISKGGGPHKEQRVDSKYGKELNGDSLKTGRKNRRSSRSTKVAKVQYGKHRGRDESTATKRKRPSSRLKNCTSSSKRYSRSRVRAATKKATNSDCPVDSDTCNQTKINHISQSGRTQTPTISHNSALDALSFVAIRAVRRETNGLSP